MTITLLAALVGIALLDSLNPSLFVAQFYLLTTPRPVPRLLAYVAGVLVVNLGGGALILGGARTLLAELLARVSNPAWYAGVLVLGLALLLFGLRMQTDAAPEQAKKPRSLHLHQTFLLGMLVMLDELTTALPYFVAIERIAGAHLSIWGNAAALTLYNAVFALPLFGFIAAYVVLKDRFTAQISAINAWVQRWTPRIVKWSLIIFGAALMLNAGWYFAAGRSLIG